MTMKEGTTVPNSDLELDDLIRDRDDAREAADKLAAAVAEFFDLDIGEHSNSNDPWLTALVGVQRAIKASRPPSRETIWVLRAPCGCPVGATIRTMSEPEAWTELAGNGRTAEGEGFTLAAEPRRQAMEDVRARLGHCTHQVTTGARPNVNEGGDDHA